MRQVSVIMAWITNAFENSSQHSEYYLDLQNGDVRFFSPLDFPEHTEMITKLERQTNRFVRLPKLSEELSCKIKQDYASTIEDPDLKNRLLKELDTDAKFKKVLMEYEDERHNWYTFQNSRLAQYLKEWFKEREIELLEKTT